MKIRGATVVRNKLQKASVTIGEGFDRSTGNDMLDHLFNSMPNYPPEVPGQQYVRTLSLQKALESTRGGMSLSEVTAIGGEQVVILGLRGGSKDMYGPAVVGFTDQQRAIHKGRWFTLLSHVEDQLGKLVDIVSKGTKRLLRRAGF